jgi:hypothetical protein
MYFGECPAHRREALETFDALEDVAGRPLLAVTADVTVEAVLGPDVTAPHAEHSPADIDQPLALQEEELGDPTLLPDALEVARADRVLRALLGPVAPLNTWDPETVWLRSLRGVINERVRHRGGCTCADTAWTRGTASTRVH